MHNHSNITKGENAKIKKGRVVFHVCDKLPCFVLHSCQVPSKYSKGYSSYRVDIKSISNKKRKKGKLKIRVLILVCDMLSRPVLHYYQVSSKYSKGYSSYRVDKKFYSDVDGIRSKNNMSPHPSEGWGIIISHHK